MKRRSFMQMLGFGGAAVAVGGFAPNVEEPVYFKGESPEEKAAATRHSSAGGTIAMFVSTT